MEKISISEADAIDALEEKLLNAVRLRMVADVPIGALLSGGVDSSLVVAMMAKLNGGAVKTFSVGFAEENFSELPYARQVSTAMERSTFRKSFMATSRRSFPSLSSTTANLLLIRRLFLHSPYANRHNGMCQLS